jgi:hypothetical protein
MLSNQRNPRIRDCPTHACFQSNPAIRKIAQYIPLYLERNSIQVFYRPTRNIPMCLVMHFTPPPASIMMNTKKNHSGKRKRYILSDHPRNNVDKKSLKYAKTPSMYSYIKLPVGRPTKTIDPKMIDPSPPTADTAITPATDTAANQASSVKVKMSSKTCDLYNKHDDTSG